MKTSQLISVLQEKLETHGDLDIVTIWDGVVENKVRKSNLFKGVTRHEKESVLFLDANDNRDKNDKALDYTEGELKNCKSCGLSFEGIIGDVFLPRNDDGELILCEDCEYK